MEESCGENRRRRHLWSLVLGLTVIDLHPHKRCTHVRMIISLQ